MLSSGLFQNSIFWTLLEFYLLELKFYLHGIKLAGNQLKYFHIHSSSSRQKYAMVDLLIDPILDVLEFLMCRVISFPVTCPSYNLMDHVEALPLPIGIKMSVH